VAKNYAALSTTNKRNSEGICILKQTKYVRLVKNTGTYCVRQNKVKACYGLTDLVDTVK
jgi:hypothetical protein